MADSISKAAEEEEPRKRAPSSPLPGPTPKRVSREAEAGPRVESLVEVCLELFRTRARTKRDALVAWRETGSLLHGHGSE
jgi:hypothetical protein